MIKVEVIEKFSYAKYEEIKDTLKRKSTDEKGMLFVGDTFECDKETVEYLTGKNALNKTVVKVIEVKPEKVIPLTDNEELEEKSTALLGNFNERNDREAIIPLDKEALEKLSKAIEKHIETKPKTSKKKTTKKKK